MRSLQQILSCRHLSWGSRKGDGRLARNGGGDLATLEVGLRMVAYQLNVNTTLDTQGELTVMVRLHKP